MCTLTAISIAGHAAAGSPPFLRVIFNRDEQRSRPLGVAPKPHAAGPRRALYPTDPQSGGTWIGVNDAGLVAALLNATGPADLDSPRSPPAPPSGRSRGLIIPQVLSNSTIHDALAHILKLDLQATASFRLWLTDGRNHAMLTGTRGTLQASSLRPFSSPVMLTSSGLGDALVQQPRTDVFERTFADPAHCERAQRDFHRWHEPTSGATSVMMSRSDARTVSRTTVELHTSFAQLSYLALDDRLLPMDSGTTERLTLQPAGAPL